MMISPDNHTVSAPFPLTYGACCPAAQAGRQMGTAHAVATEETHVEGGALEGSQRRKPSPVASAVTPWPTNAGRSSVVVSRLLRSWNSGSSHAAGLGTTTPTLGKLPK